MIPFIKIQGNIIKFNKDNTILPVLAVATTITTTTTTSSSSISSSCCFLLQVLFIQCLRRCRLFNDRTWEGNFRTIVSLGFFCFISFFRWSEKQTSICPLHSASNVTPTDHPWTYLECIYFTLLKYRHVFTNYAEQNILKPLEQPQRSVKQKTFEDLTSNCLRLRNKIKYISNETMLLVLAYKYERCWNNESDLIVATIYDWYGTHY